MLTVCYVLGSALLMLYRHGPSITLPVIETEIGFWNLPARFEQSPEQMSAVCDAITWQQSGFWLNHLNQCAELVSDKEQGFVRTARSATLFAAGLAALRRSGALPELLLGQCRTVWRMVVEHEWAVLAAVLVTSCEFLPRIARELLAHIDLHLQNCAAASSPLLLDVVQEGGDGGDGGGGGGPDGWVRSAWVACAVGAHYCLVVGAWWVAAPTMRRVIFDA